jgi:hypothetical protein
MRKEMIYNLHFAAAAAIPPSKVEKLDLPYWGAPVAVLAEEAQWASRMYSAAMDNRLDTFLKTNPPPKPLHSPR